MANPGDRGELDTDDADGDGCRRFYMGNEVRQCMAETAEGRHDSAGNAADERTAASSHAAVVGKRFRKTHADSSANAGGEPDEKGISALMRRDGGGKERGQR